ncbi:TSUP family transporter [Sutterella sp.]|uniref:sulfite exporter TauE/SafE family protein n=1 Tax=Sutterella sp. TaxID=1981025 RepID=UPI0026DF65CA|nr:TSUP family transporter [Sutterella sp.]MDO5532335.1 TSUP family transporter [Sutterella sp.]
MEFDLTALLIICPLIFVGGLVDAIGGGGGLITLPAYLIAGVPPHAALATNKLSGTIGTTVSAFRLWKAGFLKIGTAIPSVICALIGSAAGARLALLVPEDAFRLLLVFALPVAAFFIFRKSSIPAEGEPMDERARTVKLCIASAICGAYDGFYGPGTGTFLLLAFTLWARLGVRDASGQMKAVNLASNAAAFATFALSGEMLWVTGLIASVFGIAGNYIGAGLVLKNGTKIVRPIIILVLAILFVKTAWEFLA